MEFNEYVRSLGLEPQNLTPEQAQVLESAWRASSKPGSGGPPKKDTLDDVVAKAEAENARQAGIVALIKTYLDRAPDRVKELHAIGELALKGGWTVKEAEYQLLKGTYASGPLPYSPSQQSQVNQQVVEAAVCRAAGLRREAVERSYSDQVLSMADRHFRGGCGLQRLLTLAANANGHRDAHVSNMRHLLRAAFQGGDGPTAATGYGPSTYSVPGILSNVANKFVIDAFMAIESVWRAISYQRPVSDFKQITSYALTGDLTYEEVGAGGEIKHGTFGEEEYTNQAKMYGKMLGIDYRDIRNDDLGAFAKLMTRMGRGGALTINKVFWTAFLAGQGTFWAAGNSNYFAATDYAFARAGLNKANIKWKARRDPDGQVMGDKARFLLVPSAYEVDAKEIMSSTRLSYDNGEGEVNGLAGMWTPLSSEYLSDSTISGSSDANYFIVADPAATPVIEVVFLDGQETPVVETAEPDFNRQGIMILGTHAFGVNKQEPRAAIKFKPTAD